jgi:hypothetical protein
VIVLGSHGILFSGGFGLGHRHTGFRFGWIDCCLQFCVRTYVCVCVCVCVCVLSASPFLVVPRPFLLCHTVSCRAVVVPCHCRNAPCTCVCVCVCVCVRVVCLTVSCRASPFLAVSYRFLPCRRRAVVDSLTHSLTHSLSHTHHPDTRTTPEHQPDTHTIPAHQSHIHTTPTHHEYTTSTLILIPTPHVTIHTPSYTV